MAYRKAFYSERNKRTRASAERIIGIVREKYPFRSMVDVGCGVGTWLSVALDKGAVVAEGIEGHWLKPDFVEDDRILVHRQDLAYGINLTHEFDFAVSLEVAEHLPQARANSFVEELCGLAPCVLFGAAMPGQTGGVGHINLQWQGWWAEKFRENGFAPVDLVRPQIWHEQDIPLWYRQNAILYIKPQLSDEIGLQTSSDRFIADIVHPEMFLRSHKPKGSVKKLLRKLRRRPV